MKLKIRTKVLLGILFLFIEFLIIGTLSIYYYSSLKSSTELMIKNNYQSVQYSENMIQAIDETHTAVTSIFLNKLYHYNKNTLTAFFNKFEENLSLEEKNITEFGEKELAQSMDEKYFKYKSLVLAQKPDSMDDRVNFYFINILPLLNELKANIFSVSTLNMHAIIQKNENLNAMVNRIYKNLTIVLTVCFLITFSFMFNFPNYIAKPIREITESIKEIANKNFKSRILISVDDEFGQLAEAFNHMAEKLEKNYQPVVIEKQYKEEDKTIDEIPVLQNIKTLLTSVRTLIDAISKVRSDETLHRQSEILRDVEQELTKIIKS